MLTKWQYHSLLALFLIFFIARTITGDKFYTILQTTCFILIMLDLFVVYRKTGKWPRPWWSPRDPRK